MFRLEQMDGKKAPWLGHEAPVTAKGEAKLLRPSGGVY